MKPLRRLLIFLCVLLLSHVSDAKNIKAYIHNCTFLTGNKPYVETGISITGQSLIYTKNSNGKYQAAVDIIIFYRPVNKPLKKDSAQTKYYNYTLHSPELKDTNNITFDLYDLKRISLNNNTKYNVEVDLTDEAQHADKITLYDVVEINYDTTSIQLSDITLIDTLMYTLQNNIYTKDGYGIQPRPFNYYPTDKTKLTFYTEVYDMRTAVHKYSVTYFVSKSSDSIAVNDFLKVLQQNPARENFVLSSFDITQLPSGNYFLNAEVRDSVGKILAAKKLYFQRSNKRPSSQIAVLTNGKINNFTQHIPKDSLLFYLKCLEPVAGSNEKQYIENAAETHDTVLERQFIYNFWSKRDADHPETVFKKYMIDVYYAEDEFGTGIRHGFETDRGRVYLQYGKPNQRDVHNAEASALPYEQWHYYTIPNGQSNVFFIFYEPDEVTNDYTLIYSDANGESKDNQWQQKIFNPNGSNSGYMNNYNSNIPGSSYPSNLNTPH